jgi:hypothetical protein
MSNSKRNLFIKYAKKKLKGYIMGNCIYCGKPAGFLKKAHKECFEKYEQGKVKIISLVSKIATEGDDIQQLKNSIEQIAEKSYIKNETLNSIVSLGWEKSVELALDDDLLSKEEEEMLINLMSHFSIPEQVLDRNGAYSKLVKGAVLRDIMEGNLQERLIIEGNLPFNFQKSEKLVWVFKGVKYYEEKTRTRYSGGSKGVNIRVAKGLYYRTGGFKAERIQSSETVHADTGFLGVTDKHIYFAGSSKRFRIPYKKIVAFEPFSDGIGVQRDAQTAKPQSFKTGDGWFTYNLITNLAQM